MLLFTLAVYSALCAALPGVLGTIYVTRPLESTICSGDKSCAVEWVDDGVAPNLNDIGPCYVGLYNGNGDLVQQIEPVNVASVHSLAFTVDSAAGSNSNKYYINFTATNPAMSYAQFSTFFTLNGMKGSLSSTNPSATSAIPIPSTVASPAAPSVSLTITVNATQPSVSISGSASSNAAPTTNTSASLSSGTPSPSASPVPPTPSSVPHYASSDAAPSSSSSFITIRTSATVSLAPPSGTTLSIPPTSTSGSSVPTIPSSSPLPSAPSGTAETSGAGFSRPGSGVSVVGLCMAVMLVVVTWI